MRKLGDDTLYTVALTFLGVGYVTAILFGLCSLAFGWKLYWAAAVAFVATCAVTALVGRYRFRRDLPEDRARRGLCPDCGYDMTGNVSGRCPECGTDHLPASFRPRDRRWPPLLSGLVCGFATAPVLWVLLTDLLTLVFHRPALAALLGGMLSAALGVYIGRWIYVEETRRRRSHQASQ